jgi:hypothetical protein
VDCDEELAKKIGIDVVDQRISVHELWPQAEKKDSGFDLDGDAATEKQLPIHRKFLPQAPQ